MVSDERYQMIRFLKRYGGLAAVVIVLLLIYAFIPLRDAFMFSQDEGYEVIKPFLFNKGYPLYKEIWSDQPPVFTHLLAFAFRAFGSTILVARLVVAATALVLFGSFYEMIRRRSGQPTALLSSFLLLASPGVLLLSSSAMQEVPTLALGLFSALLASNSAQQKSVFLFGLSGAFLGMAIQTKLTAILLAPAICVELILRSEGKISLPWNRQTLSHLMIWGLSAGALVTLIGLTWGKGSFQPAFEAHTGNQFVSGMDRAVDHKFETRLLWIHLECILSAIVAVMMALRSKRFREIRFPVTLLLTDSLIHALHKPWWNYYYIHIAIPVAWLAGWSLNEVIRMILQYYAKKRFALRNAVSWKQITLCALTALVIARSERRLEGNIKELRDEPLIEANPIIQEMKKHVRTQWSYADPVIYAFHSGISVPPELAVITSKRFWSRQITTDSIIEACKTNKVELLVLPKNALDGKWHSLLDGHYHIAVKDNESILYILKDSL